jgi:hypothetical protein
MDEFPVDPAPEVGGNELYVFDSGLAPDANWEEFGPHANRCPVNNRLTLMNMVKLLQRGQKLEARDRRKISEPVAASVSDNPS